MAKHHWNVLVFPGGMENGIEIYNSLKHCKEVSLFSASSAVPNQAFFLYQDNHIVRDVREKGWVEDLNRVVDICQIDVIYPANSFVIDALFEKRHEIHTSILLPDEQVLRITRSKKLTLQTLRDTLPVPRVYASATEPDKFPLFAKLDKGYGAQGARILQNKQEADAIDFSKFVVQEFLPGKEYTVDCLSDNDGNLLFAAGRERSRIRMATSMHAEPLLPQTDEYFRLCARKILKKIKISGAWFFQMKADAEGNLKLLEIDVRIAGTMCYHRCYGVNFALLGLYLFFGLPVSVCPNKPKLVLDRALCNRYLLDYEYENVYIDLDDTIISKGHINTDIIKFLYQCVNKKKKIILLSKHLGENKTAYLKKWRIESLFDQVIWLKEKDKKYKYITKSKSIYIDDSFSQRQEVAAQLNIPTFDASMTECLFDERIVC